MQYNLIYNTLFIHYITNYFQKQTSSTSIIDQINKWSSGFEEVDPLLRFERMNLDEVSKGHIVANYYQYQPCHYYLLLETEIFRKNP